MALYPAGITTSFAFVYFAAALCVRIVGFFICLLVVFTVISPIRCYSIYSTVNPDSWQYASTFDPR